MVFSLSSLLQNIGQSTTAPKNQFSQSQLEAVDYMSNILQHDKSAYVIALTSVSYNALSLAGPPYQLSSSSNFFIVQKTLKFL